MFHTVQLSKSDPTPLYIQLASELANLIQADLLKGGTKLPAIRYLSKQLAINRDTVVSAYKLLENQGLVEGYIGKGTYVVPSQSKKVHTPTNTNICCSTLGFPKETFSSSLCLDLATKLITDEGWDALSDPLYRSRHFLKQSIANFFAKNLNLHPHFAEVRLIESMNAFLLSLFKCSPKVGICVENYRDLTYSCYLRSMGAKIYDIPLTSEGLDLDILEKHLRTGTISYIWASPYLQNPTGICYSEANKTQLLELAKEYDCYIIEDGTFNEFIYDNTPLSPLYSKATSDQVIFLYHFSKLYMPYLSYSFSILPHKLIKRLSDDVSCSFNENLLRYYLNSPYLLNLQQHLIISHKDKYNLVLKYLRSCNCDIPHSHGGLSFWFRSQDINKDTLCQFFSQHGFIVSPGNLFTSEDDCDFVRLAISQLSNEAIDKLISLLSSNPF